MSHSNEQSLPHSNEAERYVLGAILKQPQVLDDVLPIMEDGQSFYSPKHRTIYDAMLRLHHKQEPVDIVSVNGLLQQRNELERLGGRTYVIELAEGIASTANTVHHVGTILDKAKLRTVIKNCQDVIGKAYNGEPTRDVVDNFRQLAFDIDSGKTGTDFTKLGDFNDDFLQRVDDYQTGEYWKHALRTGFSGLDKSILGMPYGGLITIAARTSHGKTQLATQIATNVAKSGVPAAFVSLEMNKMKISERVHCYEAHVDSERMKRAGLLTDDENSKLLRATARTKDYPLYVSDNPSVTPDQLLSSLRKLMIKLPDLKLVVVDYLQLMNQPGMKKASRQEVVSSITRGLKLLAIELDVVVIQLSQFNRDGGRENRKPSLSELRESGAIEQDSDIVIFCWHETNQAKIVLASWLVVAKNRDGARMPDIAMNFNFGQWAEIEERMEL